MPAGSDSADVESISCGAHGEWFVRYAEGSWRAHNIPDGLNERIDNIHAQGEDIVSIEFGSQGSWVLTYQ